MGQRRQRCTKIHQGAPEIAIHRMHVNQDPLQEIFARYIAIFNHPIIYISFSFDSGAPCATARRRRVGSQTGARLAPGRHQ